MYPCEFEHSRLIFSSVHIFNLNQIYKDSFVQYRTFYKTNVFIKLHKEGGLLKYLENTSVHLILSEYVPTQNSIIMLFPCLGDQMWTSGEHFHFQTESHYIPSTCILLSGRWMRRVKIQENIMNNKLY